MHLAHLLDRRFAGTLAVSGAAVLLALVLGHGIRTGWLEPARLMSTSSGEHALGYGAQGAASDAERVRPQTPPQPYPWRERDASFFSASSSQGETRIAGTLALPSVASSAQPAPAVVLISGAGPQDRDGTFFGHKRFLVLTQTLIDAGFAVLRLDDRGVGESGGSQVDADLQALVDDTQAALEWLRDQPDINSQSLGLLGLSLGGQIGAMTASQSDAVAFLILASTMGRPGDELLVAQQDRLLAMRGHSVAEREEGTALMRQAITLALQDLDDVERRDRLRPIVRRLAELAPSTSGPLSVQPSESQIEQQIDLLLSPQMRDTLTLDPAYFLRRVRCPVLVLHGELDMQVDAEANVPRIVEALPNGTPAEEATAQVRVARFEGLNHLLQPAETGLPEEYAQIDITIAPEVLRALAQWLEEVVLASNEASGEGA